MKNDCVQVAKEIRKALKLAFPYTKFSVTSSRYSMGSSVSVSWDNTPTAKQVEAITEQYSSVRYCEATGETLSGGNMFVFARPEITKEFKATVEAQMNDCDINDYFRYNRAFNEIVKTLYADFLAQQSKSDGIEIAFPSKPNQDIIDSLKSNGFKWSRRGFWCAKNNRNTLLFAQSLCSPKGEITADDIPSNETNENSDNNIEITEATISQQADIIIDISASVILDNNLNYTNMSESEYALYFSELSRHISLSSFALSQDIIDYLSHNKSFATLCEALTAILLYNSANTTDNSDNTNGLEYLGMAITEADNSSYMIDNNPIWTITALQYQAYKNVKNIKTS